MCLTKIQPLLGGLKKDNYFFTRGMYALAASLLFVVGVLQTAATVQPYKATRTTLLANAASSFTVRGEKGPRDYASDVRRLGPSSSLASATDLTHRRRRRAASSQDYVTGPCLFPSANQSVATDFGGTVGPSDVFTDMVMDGNMIIQSFANRVVRLSTTTMTSSTITQTSNGASVTVWSTQFTLASQIGRLFPASSVIVDFDGTPAQPASTARFINIVSMSFNFHLYIADETYLRVAILSQTSPISITALQTLAGTAANGVVDGVGTVATLSNINIISTTFDYDVAPGSLFIFFSDRVYRCVRLAAVADDSNPLASGTQVSRFAGSCSLSDPVLTAPTVGSYNVARFVKPGAITVGLSATYIIDGTRFILRMNTGAVSLVGQLPVTFDASSNTAFERDNSLNSDAPLLYFGSVHSPCNIVEFDAAQLAYRMVLTDSVTSGAYPATCVGGGGNQRVPIRVTRFPHNGSFLIAQTGAQSTPLWAVGSCTTGTAPVPVATTTQQSFISFTPPPTTTTSTPTTSPATTSAVVNTTATTANATNVANVTATNATYNVTTSLSFLSTTAATALSLGQSYTKPPTLGEVLEASPPPSNSTNRGSVGLSPGILAGAIVVGVVASLVLLGTIIFVIRRRRKMLQRQRYRDSRVLEETYADRNMSSASVGGDGGDAASAAAAVNGGSRQDHPRHEEQTTTKTSSERRPWVAPIKA